MLGLNQISLAVNRLYGPGAPAPALSLDFTSGSLGTATLTRSSTGTRFNSSGLIESVAVDGARFDYNPVTLSALGLLVEPSRTNTSLYSNTASSWTTWGNGTKTDNVVTGPDGLTSGNRFVDNSANSNHGIYVNTGQYTAVPRTRTIYLKYLDHRYIAVRQDFPTGASNSGWVVIDLLNGVISTKGAGVTSATLTSVDNGWYLYEGVWTPNSSASANANSAITMLPNSTYPPSHDAPAYVGTGTGFYWFGNQEEVGSFPTSYIPTTTASVTRSADVAVVPIPSTVSNIRITYEDDTTSDVAVTPSTNYTIPTSQKAVKSIISI